MLDLDLEGKVRMAIGALKKTLDFDDSTLEVIPPKRPRISADTKKSKKEIEIVGDIPVDLPLVDGRSFLFISKDQRLYTHGIHKYPAKFFPELPRWIIQRYSKVGDLILEPFMGSGTTNLEAMLLLRSSVGVDVDPFSRLLSRVKTLPLSREYLADIDRIYDYLDLYDSDTVNVSLPDFPYRDNWFCRDALHEMAYIKAGIDKLGFGLETRDFLRICFSSIVRQSSQADNNCTRTVIRQKLNKQVPAGYALKFFRKRLRNAIDGMTALSDRLESVSSVNVEIPDDCSATDLSRYDDETFSLALTSPPYANAVDYPRTHQLELYWLGLASGSLQELKRTHVGTEAVIASEYNFLTKTGIESADKVIESIYEVDKRRAFIASKYILDMTQNMREVHRVLKSGGRYVIVVGSNSMRGHEFETWRYLVDVAPSLGYEVETWFISKIINHFIKVPRKERINDDYVLVLRKR